MKNAHSVMNNTKWEELRAQMLLLGSLSPEWRTLDTETGHLSEWDGEWFHHFRQGGYKTIEWVEIQITSPEQEKAVLAALRAVHLPGGKTNSGFRVYGYVQEGALVEYI